MDGKKARLGNHAVLLLLLNLYPCEGRLHYSCVSARPAVSQIPKPVNTLSRDLGALKCSQVPKMATSL
jgi:hypothetical protein